MLQISFQLIRRCDLEAEILKRFTSSSNSSLIENVGPVPYHGYPSKGLLSSPAPGRCYSVVDLRTCGPADLGIFYILLQWNMISALIVIVWLGFEVLALADIHSVH